MGLTVKSTHIDQVLVIHKIHSSQKCNFLIRHNYCAYKSYKNYGHLFPFLYIYWNHIFGKGLGTGQTQFHIHSLLEKINLHPSSNLKI